MSMVTVAMVALPITPTPAAIPPPRHVSFFEFFASTPPQTSPKSSWFSPNNGRASSRARGARTPTGTRGRGTRPRRYLCRGHQHPLPHGGQPARGRPPQDPRRGRGRGGVAAPRGLAPAGLLAE